MKAISAITSNSARIPPIIPPMSAPLLEFGALVVGTATIVLPLKVGNWSASISDVLLIDAESESVVVLPSSNVDLDVIVVELEASDTTSGGDVVVSPDAIAVVVVEICICIVCVVCDAIAPLVVGGVADVVVVVVHVGGGVADVVDANIIVEVVVVAVVGFVDEVEVVEFGLLDVSGAIRVGAMSGNGVVVIILDNVVGIVEDGVVHGRGPQLLGDVQTGGSGLDSQYCKIQPLALKITHSRLLTRQFFSSLSLPSCKMLQQTATINRLIKSFSCILTKF